MKLIKSATVWWGVNLDFYGEAKEQDVLKGKTGDLLKNRLWHNNRFISKAPEPLWW